MFYQAVATSGCSNIHSDAVGLQRFARDPVLGEVMARISPTPRSQDWELCKARSF